MEIRATRKSDFAAVDRLLAESYPVLLKKDYPASVLVTALPIISRARPELVVSDTYYGVFSENRLNGAGGWTRAAPGGATKKAGVGHIRHVVVDHRSVRKGVGRALMEHVLKTAASAGITQLLAQSTLTAEPFYQACGFRSLGEINVPLGPGIVFPAVKMSLELA